MSQFPALETDDLSQSQNGIVAAELRTERAREHVEAAVKGNTPTPQALDGGVKAWVQCASCFCLFLNSWGIFNTFGATVGTSHRFWRLTSYQVHTKHSTN